MQAAALAARPIPGERLLATSTHEVLRFDSPV
jgi:hypothetical protein